MSRAGKFKSLIIAVILSVFACAFSYATIMESEKAYKSEYDPHGIVVKFRPHVISLPFGGRTVDLHEAAVGPVSVSELNRMHKVMKLKKIFRYAQEGITHAYNKRGELVRIEDLSGYYKIYFPEDVDVKEALADYKADPNVELAELEWKMHMMEIPSDADFSKQWGLNNAGQTGGTADCDIDAPEAWDISKGTFEVVVAVVDSGVDTDHPDLQSKLLILPGCNFIAGEDPDDPNPVPTGGDDAGCEHGTHVAGIAAAITDNATANGSVAGVGWNCKIMPVKVLDNSGSGWPSDIAAGIEFAALNGADVINLSLGGSYSSYFQSCINNAYAADCVIVAAAGNSGQNIDLNQLSPVCNDGSDGVNRVVGVAATNHNDAKSYYSNFGARYVDVSAPGGDASSSTSKIYSTVFHDPAYGFGNWFDYMMGTSMAAPFVSGLAALIKSQDRTRSNAEVINILKNSTDYIDGKNPGYPGKLGTGRINALLALGYESNHVTYPPQSSTVYGYVIFVGTATWEGAGYYSVSTAEGVNPPAPNFRLFLLSNECKVEEPLAGWDTTGMTGTYTIKLDVYGESMPATVETTKVIYIGTDSGHVKLIGATLGGPNPFNPNRDQRYVINYNLSANADTKIYIYNLAGQLMWRKTYSAGTMGGRQGNNKVEWHGESDFGVSLANGVYLYQVISNNRVLGREKIIILK